MTSLGPEIIIKTGLSIQRSVVESFSFRGKNVQSMHVSDLGECLVGIDVSRAIGYADDNNGRRAIKSHVPQKYMMRFEDVKDIVERRYVHLDVPQDDAILLKEPSLYCFLLRCKMPGGEPFMEWAVETVLPRQVRKLASSIEEKNNQIQALESTNEKHQQKILRHNEEIDDLIANRHVARRGYFDNVLYFIKKNCREVNPFYIIRCQYKQLEEHKQWLILCYPNMEMADKCDDPNAIHRWNRLKREVIKKPNYYKNHFSLTKEKRELLETALDVTI